MTTPANSALHMMEGMALAEAYAHHLVAVDFWSGKVQNSALLDPAYKAKAALEAAFKTSFDHWVDEVEASGEAEKHAGVTAEILAAKVGDLVMSVAEQQAMPDDWWKPHLAAILAELETVRYELDQFKALYTAAFEGLVRERGITKEMAAALQAAFEALASIDGAFQKERVMCFDALAKVQP